VNQLTNIQFKTLTLTIIFHYLVWYS